MSNGSNTRGTRPGCHWRDDGTSKTLVILLLKPTLESQSVFISDSAESASLERLTNTDDSRIRAKPWTSRQPHASPRLSEQWAALAHYTHMITWPFPRRMSLIRSQWRRRRLCNCLPLGRRRGKTLTADWVVQLGGELCWRTDGRLGGSLEGEEESDLDFIANLVKICKVVTDQDESFIVFFSPLSSGEEQLQGKSWVICRFISSDRTPTNISWLAQWFEHRRGAEGGGGTVWTGSSKI